MWLAPLALLAAVTLQGPHVAADGSSSMSLVTETAKFMGGDIVEAMTRSLGGGQEKTDESDVTSFTHGSKHNSAVQHGENLDEKHSDTNKNTGLTGVAASSLHENSDNVKETEQKHQERSKRSSETELSVSSAEREENKNYFNGDPIHGFNKRQMRKTDSKPHKKGTDSSYSSSDSDETTKRSTSMKITEGFHHRPGFYRHPAEHPHFSRNRRSSETDLSTSSDEQKIEKNYFNGEGKPFGDYGDHIHGFNKRQMRKTDSKTHKKRIDSSYSSSDSDEPSKRSTYMKITEGFHHRTGFDRHPAEHPHFLRNRRDASDNKSNDKESNDDSNGSDTKKANENSSYGSDSGEGSSSDDHGEAKSKHQWHNRPQVVRRGPHRIGFKHHLPHQLNGYPNLHRRHSPGKEPHSENIAKTDAMVKMVTMYDKASSTDKYKDNKNSNGKQETDTFVIVKENKCPTNKCSENRLDDKKWAEKGKEGVFSGLMKNLKGALNGFDSKSNSDSSENK